MVSNLTDSVRQDLHECTPPSVFRNCRNHRNAEIDRCCVAFGKSVQHLLSSSLVQSERRRRGVDHFPMAPGGGSGGRRGLTDKSSLIT